MLGCDRFGCWSMSKMSYTITIAGGSTSGLPVKNSRGCWQQQQQQQPLFARKRDTWSCFRRWPCAGDPDLFENADISLLSALHVRRTSNHAVARNICETLVAHLRRVISSTIEKLGMVVRVLVYFVQGSCKL